VQSRSSSREKLAVEEADTDETQDSTQRAVQSRSSSREKLAVEENSAGRHR
jgi:hypothetical protein